MTQAERDAPYRCAFCGRWHVVPGLARDCEARDAKLAGLCTPDATIASRQDDDCE
jgi:hypothetical protein